MNITEQKKADNHLNIIINLTPEDYLPKVDAGLKQLAKKASVPGFRIGHAPVGLVKRNYGNEVLADELNKMVNESLQKFIEEKKWNIFAQPVPYNVSNQRIDIASPAAIDFGFEIGLMPEFLIANLENQSFDLNKVDITEEMVQEEVEKLQMRHGNMITPETVSEEDIVVADYTELNDDGSIKEGGIASSASVAINKIADDKIRKSVLSSKVEETMEVDIFKMFNNDHNMIVHHILNVDHHTADQMGGKFKMTIKNFNHINKAELNQELFDKTFGKDKVTNEEELRNRLRSELQTAYERAAQSRLSVSIRDWMIANTNINLPEDYLKSYLLYINEGKITPEQIEAEMPYFIQQLRWDLISGNLSRENNLESNDKELKQFVKQEFANEYFGGQLEGMEDSLEKIADMVMNDEKNLKTYRDRLMNDKLFALLKQKIQTTEKTISQHDFAHH